MACAFQETPGGLGELELRLVGDADLYAAAELHRRLGSAVERSRVFVTLDLTCVETIDMSVLALIVSRTGRLARLGGSLTVVVQDGTEPARVLAVPAEAGHVRVRAASQPQSRRVA